MPKVSILMPTYEPNPSHLREALECIQNQTFQDFTVLIRDDASDADVHAMVKPFLNDARFQFLRGARRLGIGGNWNACLKNLTSEYVQFFFQDDRWNPEYLAQCVAAADGALDADFVVTFHEYAIEGEERFTGKAKEFYGAVEKAQHALTGGKHMSREFLNSWIKSGLRPNIIGEPSFVLLKRALIERTGKFSEDLRQILDTEYWVRCLLKSESFCVVSKILGSFRVHIKGASAQNNTGRVRIKERWSFLLRHPIIAIRAILRN